MKRKNLILSLVVMGIAVSFTACSDDSERNITYERPEKVVDPDPVIREINTKIIAHRGFWKAYGASTQNTVLAMVEADKLGAYGCEFDIHLTSDQIPVAAHDATVSIKSKTFTINEYPYSTFQGKRLDSGAMLETLDDFLIAAKDKCKSIVLIIELKEQKVASFNSILAQKTVAAVEKMGLKERVEYISFSKTLLASVLQADPNAKVQFLTSYKPLPKASELKSLGVSGLDSDYNNTTEADIKDLKNGNVTSNIWTVNASIDMRKFIDYGVDFITTDEPDTALDLIEAMKRGK